MGNREASGKRFRNVPWLDTFTGEWHGFDAGYISGQEQEQDQVSSFSRMASWKPWVSSEMKLSGEGEGLTGELGVLGAFNGASRLRTWSVGVQQVRQPCLLQGDCLVQILWDS